MKKLGFVRRIRIIEELKIRFFPFKDNIRLTLFNVIAIVGIFGGLLAFIGTVFAGTNYLQFFSVLAAEIVMNLCFYLANYKGKLEFAAIAIVGIITFLIFPVMFFTGGGLYSGMPSWFILGMVFNGMLNKGTKGRIILALQIVIDSLCCIAAYINPGLVTLLENEYGVVYDIVQSMLIVGVGISFIIYFQLYFYEKVLVDIENQKKELEKANQRAEGASKAKSDFLANMSHEMRTPINAILGMNEMILRESQNEQILSYSQDVKIAADTLLSLINDVLDISKIEMGKTEIVTARYELGSLLHDCYTMIEGRAKSNNLEFNISNDNNLPNGLIGDEFHIRQVIINLLTNAVKYTKEGNVRLIIEENKDASKQDNCVNLAIRVIDTGIGIKEENIGELFSAFQRLDIEKNRAIEGTGLGLAITKQLTELMDGSIEVKSEYGKGTEFTVYITQEIYDSTPIGDFSSRYKIIKGKNSTYKKRFTAPEAKILVVDDVAMNIRVLKNLLKQTRINIDAANSGKECIDMVQKKRYDIIFMDHMMPEMDGVEAKKIMDKLENNENLLTPTIMLTANAVSGMKEQFINEGFDDYLSKPVKAEDLEDMILKYLPPNMIEY